MDAGELTPGCHRDNGFESAGAMADAHDVMIGAAVGVLEGHSGSILDLGCGNGLLVAAIARRLPGITPWGVECAADKARRANDRLSRAGGGAYAGDMFARNSPWFIGKSYLLTILMIGRLLEKDLESRASLIDAIQRYSERVLLYTYGDALSLSPEGNRLVGMTFPDATPLEGTGASLPRVWICNRRSQDRHDVRPR